MAKHYLIDKIKLENLPEYLKRLGLTVEQVEKWQRRGWIVWTKKADKNASRT